MNYIPKLMKTIFLFSFDLTILLIKLICFCQDFINRRKVTEFGNLNLVEVREENEGGKVLMRLPGARKGDMAGRSMESEIRIFSLQFSPTGKLISLPQF